MPGPGSVACPKPQALARTRARKRREDQKRLRAFRDAVWEREAAKEPWGGASGLWAYCEHCGCCVTRGDGFQTGEVYHRIGRRAKATRYDPDNGVLLCGDLLNQCYGKAQRHEIEV